MDRLSTEELFNLLKKVYVLLTEKYEAYGVDSISETTFKLTSDDSEDIICSTDGARLSDRVLSVIDSNGNERVFNLLLTSTN